MKIKTKQLKNYYNELDEILHLSIVLRSFCSQLPKTQDNKAIFASVNCIHKKISTLTYNVLTGFFIKNREIE